MKFVVEFKKIKGGLKSRLHTISFFSSIVHPTNEEYSHAEADLDEVAESEEEHAVAVRSEAVLHVAVQHVAAAAPGVGLPFLPVAPVAVEHKASEPHSAAVHSDQYDPFAEQVSAAQVVVAGRELHSDSAAQTAEYYS